MITYPETLTDFDGNQYRLKSQPTKPVNGVSFPAIYADKDGKECAPCLDFCVWLETHGRMTVPRMIQFTA